MNRSQQSRPPVNVMRQLAPLATLGVELATAVLLGGAIGWFVDGATGMKPVWTIAGFMLGIAAAIVQFTRTVQRLTRERHIVESHLSGGAER